MDDLEFAQIALERVGDIAASVGAQLRRNGAGSLGATLVIIADNIESADIERKSKLRRRVPRLVKDLETICNLPHPRVGYHAYLDMLVTEYIGSDEYKKAEAQIRQGVARFKSRQSAKPAITHLSQFLESADGRNKRPMGNEDLHAPPRKKTLPADDARGTHSVAHMTLREHICCTCNVAPGQASSGEHLVRLLLQPPSTEPDSKDNEAEYNLLVSSAPVVESSFGLWQDVQLLVPWARRRVQRRVQFSDSHCSDDGDHCKLRTTRVDRGQLCRLISLEAASRLCLTITNGELYEAGFAPLQCIVDRVPGISLAEILSRYRLTPRMKGALAYILAYSVWQYYDSDWMSTKWTSDTVHFMKETPSADTSESASGIYPWKPYISVHFGEGSIGARPGEFSNTPGEIHRFTRVKSLGIMLVEIGIGRPLRGALEERNSHHSPAARENADLLLALEHSKNRRLWGDCEYQDYLTAACNCLDPQLFRLASPPDEQAWNDSLEQRRTILYEEVVSPLHRLLQGTRWLEDITSIEPLQIGSKARLVKATEPPKSRAPASPATSTTTRLTQSQKHAHSWLSRIENLTSGLYEARSQRRRVRIAVLDTGCDDNAPFFFEDNNGDRLREWKDWTGGGNSFEDCHGHGTHLVSLIMRIAPDAHIYAARVARRPNELLAASKNVAEALTYASTVWKADIISMSFGYAEEQDDIRQAIRQTLNDRDGRILLFAAASNLGANDREMFPARHEGVISIRGTNFFGTFQDFNPPRNPHEGAVLGTLGLDVPAAGLSDFDDEVYRSGTSVATAVVAGMAGVLLGYIYGRSGDIQAVDRVREKLQSRSGMQALFRALATSSMNEHYLYVTLWELENMSHDERWYFIQRAMSAV